MKRRNKDLLENVNKLKVTLRIPSKHRKFLIEKGALDEFVEAKSTGKNELAKWALIKSAKNEINQIIKFNKKYEGMKKEEKEETSIPRSISP